MSKKYDIDALKTAFSLGFMVGREGYNMECDYWFHAPSDVEPGHPDKLEVALDYLNSNETHCGLRDKAMWIITVGALFNSIIQPSEPPPKTMQGWVKNVAIEVKSSGLRIEWYKIANMDPECVNMRTVRDVPALNAGDNVEITVKQP